MTTYGNCKKCKKGKLVKRVSINGTFLACDQFGRTHCDHTEALPLGHCPMCDDGFITKLTGSRMADGWQCKSCNWKTNYEPILSTCPECEVGWLERTKKGIQCGMCRSSYDESIINDYPNERVDREFMDREIEKERE